jgi:drug/metabolite transporter (DMT)-like permease
LLEKDCVKIDRGVWAALGAAVLFGLSTPLAKILLADISPMMLAGLLYTGSGLGLALLLGIRALGRGGMGPIVVPRGFALVWLFAAVFLGGALGPFLLMSGLSKMDSASASMTLNLEGVFTALLAWFVFKENFDRRILLGMALIIAGGILLSSSVGVRAGGFAGPALIVGACVAWAIDNNLTRKISINDAMLVACTKGLVAGPITVAIAVYWGSPTVGALDSFKAGLLGFAGYGLSLTLFVVALRRLGTARTGAYFSLAPFVGAALAVALGAPLTVSLLAAGVLMGLGIWLHLTEKHVHTHSHVLMQHEHSHAHDEHHQHAHGSEWQGEQPHTHFHVHEPLDHTHEHFPDVHHRHKH